MKFVDCVRIHAKAGDGGNGCCSFRREKFVPKGGPDGGDGGNGGSIVLRADHDTASLAAFFYEPELRARAGGHGQGSGRHGRNAADLVVRVPVGTLVYRVEPPQSGGRGEWEVEDEEEAAEGEGAGVEDGLGEWGAGRRRSRLPDTRRMTPVFDLAEDGQEVVLCRGGRGGRGNASFKSSVNRAPRQFTRGEKGEEGWFLLELRTIAFAGLVGFPNAGKSTLLGAVSAAHPKVAAYPFTTLHPMVGVVDAGDYRTLTVADIPGLIEGSHANRGLGHEFLRHILRCRHLLLVVDTAGTEGRRPAEDLRCLRRELELYDPLLAAKPWSIVANKMDLPGAEEGLEEVRAAFPGRAIVAVSAGERRGIGALVEHLKELAFGRSGEVAGSILRD